MRVHFRPPLIGPPLFTYTLRHQVGWVCTEDPPQSCTLLISSVNHCSWQLISQDQGIFPLVLNQNNSCCISNMFSEVFVWFFKQRRSSFSLVQLPEPPFLCFWFLAAHVHWASQPQLCDHQSAGYQHNGCHVIPEIILFCVLALLLSHKQKFGAQHMNLPISTLTQYLSWTWRDCNQTQKALR